MEEGLCHELNNDLIASDEPELFIDFISLLQKLDQKRHCLTRSAPACKIAPTAQQYMHTHAHVHAHAPATAATPKDPTGASTASGTHASLMDLSARRKKLTPKERARRLTEGRYLYCGGIGHVVHDCPSAHHHPLRATKAALVPHNHDPAATAATAAAATKNAAHLN